MQRAEANNYYPHLMASKLGVDANSVSATTLDWIEGASLATHTPVFCIAIWKTGASGTLVFRMMAGAVQLTTTLTAATAAWDGSAPRVNLLTRAFGLSSNPAETIDADVTTASGAAATFDVYVYGVEIAI